MTADHDRRLERWTSWLQATPAELVGLCALLLGGLAVAGVLWWGALQRPAELPPAAEHPGGSGAAGAEEVGSEIGADPSVHQEGHPGGHHHPADGYDHRDDDRSGDRDERHADGRGTQQAEAGAPVGDVVVHVSGAVADGGLVTLPAGARVGDAIEAAGGATADADPARVNLARPLQDGEHVHLPREGEEPPPGWGAGPGADGATHAPEGPGGPGDGAGERIDLNRASTAELETLPGIGPAKAAAIVRHREQHGPFREPGDLRAVSGIGEKTFQQLADLVTVP
jgi:competence protein ComEA